MKTAMNRSHFFTILFCSALLSIFGSVSSAFAGNILKANYLMPAGNGGLNSNNGCYSLRQQKDGNLVLYHNKRRTALWDTKTYNRPVKYTIMQADGNLVSYDTSNRPVWDSRTHGSGGTLAVLQDDGNFVIYAQGGRPVWATNTVSSCEATPQQAPVNSPSNSTPRSVAEAQPYHKLQNYDRYLNPQATTSNNNCGPATVATLIKLFGKEPSGLSVQASINLARQYMGIPQDPNRKADTNEMERGLRAAGLRTGNHMGDGNWAILDKDLNDGMAVTAWGWWGSQWRSQFPNYNYSGGTDHFISIVGKTPNGNYLVLDPMYRGGAVEMSRDRLAVFFSYGGGDHNGTPYFITVAK